MTRKKTYIRNKYIRSLFSRDCIIAVCEFIEIISAPILSNGASAMLSPSSTSSSAPTFYTASTISAPTAPQGNSAFESGRGEGRAGWGRKRVDRGLVARARDFAEKHRARDTVLCLFDVT